MKGNITRLPRVAEPNIEQVFDEFLAEQQKRLKTKTVSGYRDVIQLLKDYLNNYACQSLAKAETALFEKHYNAVGRDHRDFCQIFGPDKITEEFGGFLGDFMTRKVMAGADFKRLAGTVSKKLAQWLAEKDYIPEEDALMAKEEGASAARDLPKAEKAGHILYTSAESAVFDPDELNDDDYYEFDHYAIADVEPGKLYLAAFDSKGKRTVIGPITVPKEATGLLQKGWDLSCAIARIKGKWRIVEFASVYPQ